MNDPPDSDVQPGFPFSRYALEVSVGGSLEGRYRLRRDKPTWIGRRPHGSSSYQQDFEYIHVPGSHVRYHCLFEWDAQTGRFGITPYVDVWINGDDVKPELPRNCRKPRLLSESDVIIVSGESRGPRCVRVVLVAEKEKSEG